MLTDGDDMGILTSSDTYSRYYGDFKGVDFSSDHTQVHDQRLAYAVNMYKDYQSGQGCGIETIPGFRRRVSLPSFYEIYGIHTLRLRGEDGTPATKVLIHAGRNLYDWYNYPKSCGIAQTFTVALPEPEKIEEGIKIFSIALSTIDANITIHEIIGVRKSDFSAYIHELGENELGEKVLTVKGSDLSKDDKLEVSYIEGRITDENVRFDDMNERKSTSFVFNNRLYLIDGKNYLVYDGETVSSVLDNAYIPTTYINIIPSGENADAGTQKEQRNMLQPKFKHTFIADGTTTDFFVNEKDIDEVVEVRLYGTYREEGEHYTVDLLNGKISFSEAPKIPQDVIQKTRAYNDEQTILYYPEHYAGIEVTASRQQLDDNEAPISDSITKCTIATVFDNRVFLSGNPDYPNRIFWSALNNPTYFPVINWDDEGVGDSPATGMLAVADSLMVLKADTAQDGSVYFHTPTETGDDLNPKIYPSSQGLSGTGCLGACISFLDDPVFVSRLGLEAMGQLSVRLERAIEHRSSLVDAKLANLDLSKAVLEEWNGYLCLLVDGKIFMADSRQRYTHETGVMQYEWYYLEDIGIYDGQYSEYRYAAALHELEGAMVEWCPTCGEDSAYCPCSGEGITLELKVANDVYLPEYMEHRSLVGQTIGKNLQAAGPCVAKKIIVDDEGNENELAYYDVYYVVRTLKNEFTGELISREAYLLERPGNMIGGDFKPAVCLKTIDNNLFFGTTNGVICSFNFDMRDEEGNIPTSAYSFDRRTILCGCATKMDNCGVPHLTKNTLKKSTVIKTKALPSAAAKIKVRTNRKPYEQIARISSKTFSFDDMDFSDFSFVTGDQSLFAIKEKEKKWVEKQHFIYSDEYLKPFALYYIAFRYNIAGRYKQ